MENQLEIVSKIKSLIDQQFTTDDFLTKVPVVLDELIALSEHDPEGIRFFGDAADYFKQYKLNGDFSANTNAIAEEMLHNDMESAFNYFNKD